MKTIHILSSGECKNHPNPLIFVRLTRSTNGEGKHNPHPCICLRGKSSTFSHLWKLKIIYILPSLWGENQPILTSGESQNHIYPLNFVRWKSSTSLWKSSTSSHLCDFKFIHILSSSVSEICPHPLILVSWKSFKSSHLWEVKIIHIVATTTGEGEKYPHHLIFVGWRLPTSSYLFEVKIIHILSSG